MRVTTPAQAAAPNTNAVIAALINDPAALAALAAALAKSGLTDEVHASIDAAVTQHARGEAGRLLAGVVSTLTGWLIPTAGGVPAKAMVFLNGGSVATACMVSSYILPDLTAGAQVWVEAVNGVRADLLIVGLRAFTATPAAGSGGGAVNGAEGIYYPDTYGAVHDNVTDDQAAIQAAVNAAETAGAGLVWLGGYKYLIKSSVVVTSPNVRIMGMDRCATQITIATSFTASGVNTGSVVGGAIVFTQANFCAIEHIEIKGQSTASVGANANVSAIQLVASRDFRCFGMEFQYINGFGFELLGSATLAPYASFGGTLSQCHFQYCAGAMHLQSVSAGGFGCQFWGSDIDIENNIGPLDGCFVEDCNDVMISNFQGPIHIKGGSAIFFNNIDVGLQSGTNIGILVESSTNGAPVRCGFYGGVITEGGPAMKISNCSGLIISGLFINNYTTYGLEIDGGAAIDVVGCEFNTAAGGGTGYDVYLNCYHTHVSFDGCQFNSAIGGSGVAAPVYVAARSYDKWDANLFTNGGPTTTFAGPNPPYLTATNEGYNPVGNVSVTVGTSPYSVTARPYGATYYVSGGTVTSLAVGGVTLTGITSGPIRVPAQTTFVITHSGAPTVVGVGE